MSYHYGYNPYGYDFYNVGLTNSKFKNNQSYSNNEFHNQAHTTNHINTNNYYDSEADKKKIKREQKRLVKSEFLRYRNLQKFEFKN